MQREVPPPVLTQFPPVALHRSQKFPPLPPVPTHSPCWHAMPGEHVPQETRPPHPSETSPHWNPRLLHVPGVQHVPYDSPSPSAQLCGLGQLSSHSSVPPQPSDRTPHHGIDEAQVARKQPWPYSWTSSTPAQ